MELQVGAITELDGLRSRYVLSIVNYQSVERACDFLFGTDEGTRIFTHPFIADTSFRKLICTLCRFPRINHTTETIIAGTADVVLPE